MTRSIILSALLILSATAAHADNTCHLLNRSITAAKVKLERSYVTYDSPLIQYDTLSEVTQRRRSIRTAVSELDTALSASAHLGCVVEPAYKPVAEPVAEPVAAYKPSFNLSAEPSKLCKEYNLLKFQGKFDDMTDEMLSGCYGK